MALETSLSTTPTHPEKEEEQEPEPTDSVESDDDSSDEDAAGYFGAGRTQQFSFLSERGTDSAPRIRRNDSWDSFMFRSERAHRHPEKPPPASETAKRKVQFDVQNQDHVQVHRIVYNPPLTKKEHRACYMTSGDFDRIQLEMDLTMWRWENYKDGSLAEFDETQNSMRGLDDGSERERQMTVYRHTQAVLKEVVRQKTSSDYKDTLDWQRIASTSAASSKKEQERARAMAQKDAQDAIAVWENHSASTKSSEGRKSSAKPKKQKGGIWKSLAFMAVGKKKSSNKNR